MPGTVSIYIAFLATILSVGLYLASRKYNRKLLIFGRLFYYLFSLSSVFALLYLTYLFVGNRYEFIYVYAYSSIDLPLFYKISAVWGGQEGSFVLWLFFSAIMGLWLIRKSGEEESLLMPAFLAAQIFIIVLMIVRNPFEMHQIIPSDGSGLNPLLQNFWMVIHPPVMFWGYAAISIPFAFAIVSLIKNSYEDWVRITMPWVALSSAALGLGIFLGAYWSYETLGWGGFWGWDPVENSSLVPWLFVTALLHGMIVEKSRKSMRKTNLFLALTSYILVLYGTFLTRSGVLSDFSVHSFIDLGLNNYLLFFLIVSALISWMLLIMRSRGIESQPISKDFWSREFFVYLTLLFLVISAIIILVGTSAPILTGMLGNAATVRINYYISTHLPLSILFTAFMSLYPISVMKKRNQSNYRFIIIWTVIIGLTALFIGILKSVSIQHLLLLFTSSTAFAANVYFLIKTLSKDIKKTGSMIAHTGLALFIIGSLGSTGYSVSKQTHASGYKESTALDRAFKLGNIEFINPIKKDVELDVSDKNESYKAVMHFTESGDGVFRTPFIKKYLLYDFYISPTQLTESEEENSITFSKGETKIIDDYRITFTEFVMGENHQQSGMSVSARTEIEYHGKMETVFPSLIQTSKGMESKPLQTESGLVLTLSELNADQGQALIKIEGLDNSIGIIPSETLYFQVSTKPLINLVWLGGIMIIIGVLISFYRRSGQLNSMD
ncbi:MAG: cytochrome c biogenesis protein CcsA [candidate division Zixibacteria bacterium]|nr:cytochrome c biogenesis protein CcsA [candidate division Zixibacteria bacterium]